MPHAQYRDPAGGTPSSIGPQIRTDYYQKKALMEAAKEQYFGQLADTIGMPKNMGKTIKRYHYLPLLDDANINDQGIDAAGVIADGAGTGMVKATVKVVAAGALASAVGYSEEDTVWFTAEHGTAATALTNAHTAAGAWLNSKHGFGTNAGDAEAAADAAGWIITGVSAGVPDLDTVANTGNLYGSSKDVGTITSKLPALSENGGRVNRVGFKRVELEGTLEKFGLTDVALAA